MEYHRQPRKYNLIESALLTLPVGTQFTTKELGEMFNPSSRLSPTPMEIASFVKSSKYTKYTGKWAKDGKSRIWVRIDPDM